MMQAASISSDSPGSTAPSEVPDLRETELLERARTDPQAFGQLYEIYYSRIINYIYRSILDAALAEDITSNTFFKALRGLPKYRGGRFGPWLLRIVSNLSLNFRRARALRRTEPLQWTDESDGQHGRTARPDPSAVQPAEEASAREMSTLLADAVARLPDRQRQALVLFALEQMPQKEIAEMLGCSVEAVKWHVFAARKKLKEQFADYL